MVWLIKPGAGPCLPDASEENILICCRPLYTVTFKHFYHFRTHRTLWWPHTLRSDTKNSFMKGNRLFQLDIQILRMGKRLVRHRRIHGSECISHVHDKRAD